jgi:hypothetical protein
VTDTTPELEAEGLARELAHHVNNMRKEAGLDISDRITLRYDGPLAETIERFNDFLAARCSRRRWPACERSRSSLGRRAQRREGVLEIERA